MLQKVFEGFEYEVRNAIANTFRRESKVLRVVDATDLDRRERRTLERGEELRASLRAIQQPRSDFALAKFVVAQHDTPARQWAQAVLELQHKVFGIARARIDAERIAFQIEQLRAKRRKTKLDELELRRLEVDLEELDLARLGAVREADTLYEIIQAIELKANAGQPFTHEQLQHGEVEYWRLRLERQALQDMRESGTVRVGNIEAIRQMSARLGVPRPSRLTRDELRALAASTEQQGRKDAAA